MPTDVQHEVVIVGAGFAGIGMGIELQRSKVRSFLILESASEVGGTWRDNVYPGVAVDIPTFTYSFSFEPNPQWSRIFAPGAELKRYADHCVDKYGLRPHIRFDSRVRHARFDRTRGLWSVSLHDGSVVEARYLVSATGLLTQPKFPQIEGIDSFGGELLHSARWPQAMSLRGKRVAIIGTGATSVQLVPALAPEVSQLHVFQRTPIWVLPKLDAPISPELRALFRTLPTSQQLVRLATTLGTEVVMVLAIVYQKQFPWLVRTLEATSRLHLRLQVRDRALRSRLSPRYGFGCNRPTFSNTYLRAYNRANVTLEDRGIRRITATGIITSDGRAVEVDTIICATGFRTYEKGNFPTFEVVGTRGIELGDLWERERYQAYQGASVPGYPNFFTMVGPYSATGSSWFAMVENQAKHIMRCLEAAWKKGASIVEVTRSAHEAYARDIERRQRNTVFFNNDCGASHSYYFDKHGDALFYRPASGAEAYFQSRHFPLSAYRFDQFAGVEPEDDSAVSHAVSR